MVKQWGLDQKLPAGCQSEQKQGCRNTRFAQSRDVFTVSIRESGGPRGRKRVTFMLILGKSASCLRVGPLLSPEMAQRPTDDQKGR